MTKFSWIRATAILLLLLSFNVSAQTGEITDRTDEILAELTDELDISYAEAKGGVGAIFDYARDNLDADDFARIAEGIPDMDSLLDAAPRVDRDSRFGRMSGRLRDFDSSMGGIAGLAASFDELNLDPGMATEFLPIVYDYVDSASGERAMELVEGLFPDY